MTEKPWLYVDVKCVRIASKVFAPFLAAARAAEIPAIPPPTTTVS